MTMLSIETWVDARGLVCPMAIVKTAEAIKTIPIGRFDRSRCDRSRLRQ